MNGYISILIGGYDYYKTIESKIRTDIEYYVDGTISKKMDIKREQIINLEDIKKISKPLIVIGYRHEKDVKGVIQFCRDNNYKYVFASTLIDLKIRSWMLRYSGGTYIDIYDNTIEINPLFEGEITIEIASAEKYHINIGNIKVRKELKIRVAGDSGRISIGDMTTIYEMQIHCNSYGNITIGEDCLFSHGVKIHQSDQHLIFDMISHKRINYPKDVVIGNHVWIGRECGLLGGANIGAGSIVGAYSVTSGHFGKNLIIAGAPGRVIRENIIWSRDLENKNPAEYYEECEDQRALEYI